MNDRITDLIIRRTEVLEAMCAVERKLAESFGFVRNHAYVTEYEQLTYEYNTIDDKINAAMFPQPKKTILKKLLRK